MNLLKLRGSKKERKQYVDQNPFEIIADGLKSTVVDDLGKASINDAWDQLLLNDSDDSHNDSESHHAPANHGDLEEGTEFNLSDLKEKAHEITEMGREYVSEIIHAGERANAHESREISVKIQEILIEIKQLAISSGQLQKQVEIIAVEQMGEDPGIYHMNFVEQMLQTIREARMNVDDSLAWFGALRSKKAARQYSSMAKKHGTSFTLNNERQVATQVG